MAEHAHVVHTCRKAHGALALKSCEDSGTNDFEHAPQPRDNGLGRPGDDSQALDRRWIGRLDGGPRLRDRDFAMPQLLLRVGTIGPASSYSENFRRRVEYPA